jgi:hypothetical protein
MAPDAVLFLDALSVCHEKPFGKASFLASWQPNEEERETDEVDKSHSGPREVFIQGLLTRLGGHALQVGQQLAHIAR